MMIAKIGMCQSNTAEPAVNASIIDSISTKTIGAIEKQYDWLTRQLHKSSEKTLSRLKRKEERLRKKLWRKDSTAAKQIFEAGNGKYDELLHRIGDSVTPVVNSLKNYVPQIDSMQTVLKWLDQSGAAIPGLDPAQLGKIKSASAQLTALQSQVRSATDIKEFIRQRKAQLQAEFDKLGWSKELLSFKKEIFYYQQQLSEYKQMLSDPDKLAQKALSIARNTPAFKEFFSRNSFLGQLFPLPNGYGTAQALQGLQTRMGIQQQLSQQIGSASGNGINPDQYLSQQLQQAQAQLSQVKDRINKMGGGNSELEMPDFKPNSQRTKTFLNRTEYGLNIQSQRPNGLLPVTSDIGLSIGYKLNDKSVIGIGASYKMGWGRNISNIRITSEGASVRSFLDIQLKGSFWISGGFEYNYLQEFSQLDQLQNVDAWQKSGLIGITKKYKVGKKTGNVQLLWDFLSYSQVPRATPVKFRVGYNF